ncbi:hypothetical protein PYCCODRAFT_1471544 [Trametes coccinea BRFM310]|uniref:Uncharacterized protein n=1 Tax=Trametes coccinea (strain BRFM310) TaxID=1353009 RepID=A0A1Y2ICY8_TRAC3|nr:hypothetical protein PYCCODRAFT_1471544 [Trametes coccinea BRFM310]
MSDQTLSESDLLPCEDNIAPYVDPRCLELPIWTTKQDEYRLRGILDFVGQGWRFALSRVPEEATWGLKADQQDLLCYMGVPLKIIVVGVLKTLEIILTDDPTSASLAVGVELLREVDVEAHEGLLWRSTVRTAEERPKQFVARAHNQGAERIFDSFFDARDDYTSRQRMPIATAHQLAIGDILLLDVQLRRRALAPRWSAYEPFIELRHVNLLVGQPDVERTRRASSPDNFTWGL